MTSGEPPASAAGDEVVVVEDLVVRYGSTVAVDGVSFTARAGAVTTVLGPNGAGKTSTVEHLEGYRPAAGGRTRVLGLDPIADHRRLTARVGVMLQDGGIPTAIRPTELLRQYAGFFEHPLDPDDLLARVGLGHRAGTAYRRLSGGEQRRLSLALAVIGRPEVVVLDEPTAGIDLEGRDAVREVVAQLRGDGVCVLMTTHDLDEAERTSDHVVIIDRGRVVAAGAPADLVRPSDADHILFGAPPGLPVDELGDHLGAAVTRVTHGEYRVALAPTPANVAAVTSWLAEHDLPLEDLRAGRQRLDDVFRRLTAHDEPVAAPATERGRRRRRRARR
ncbi:ABC transporter ATP-binding protein [Dermatobacter hominis]|uniref:ABC transporter ATP-binding protein n=1 Tax=Dermatobacter hominis TaxID=2884263 RepID=UPI001D10E990|nr:ABC transporter ATP-binding protein [Dermatobacter hominis]UDY34070.1 ABC transporter ATP-binding protein [Dermatobacter hominis]